MGPCHADQVTMLDDLLSKGPETTHKPGRNLVHRFAEYDDIRVVFDVHRCGAQVRFPPPTLAWSATVLSSAMRSCRIFLSSSCALGMSTLSLPALERMSSSSTLDTRPSSPCASASASQTLRQVARFSSSEKSSLFRGSRSA